MAKLLFWKARLAERRRVRREAGKLRDLIITSTTLNQYSAALARFFKWAKERALAQMNPEEFDLLVSEFIEYLWVYGEPKSRANDTCSGLQHHVPNLRESS